MRFAVISDTHMNSPSTELVEEFETRMKGVDAIFHCGDYTGEDVWAYLNSHRCFIGVAGNMDDGYWSSHLPWQHSFEINGIKIGILHGFDLSLTKVEDDLVARFPEADFIFFGHTHMRFFKKEGGGPCILNPGSFTFAKKGLRGYALLTLEEGVDVEVEWINL